MRKLVILFLLVVITSLIANAQVFSYKSSTVNVNYGNGYQGEIPNESLINIDFDQEVIFIKDIEIYSVNYVVKQSFKDYRLLKCYCYDSDGTACFVELYLYDKCMYVKIVYTNFQFKYKIKY